ncbi:MAG: diguanylate cyclase [Anaerolineales bacterium]
MPRKSRTATPSGYSILLVDDSPEYVEATAQLLEQEGHTVLTAPNGLEALALLHEQRLDLVLLDYYMPGMNGEEVVTRLRQFNPHIQVILQTGYATEQPPRDMLRRLDIQGYYDKSEGPDKLLLWTDVGLKAAYTVQLLNKSRQGLRYILEATPDLHRIQPLEDLLQGILLQVAGLLGAINSFLAVLPEDNPARLAESETNGFVAMLEDDSELIIRAGTGQFHQKSNVRDALEPEGVALVYDALRHGQSKIVNTMTMVPLRLGAATIGVIYLDRPAIVERDLELLHLFANQAAVAIQNAQLYQMATLDLLTGVYVRRFFEQCLLRELRGAFRLHQTLILLMIDLDGMKRINDIGGHPAGDQALAMTGRVMIEATRGTDIVGRYGGDEFSIILSQADTEGALRLAERIIALMRTRNVPGPEGPLYLKCSVGLSLLVPQSLESQSVKRAPSSVYFRSMAHTLLQQADAALYHAKRSGGNQIYLGAPTEWLPSSAAGAVPPD